MVVELVEGVQSSVLELTSAQARSTASASLATAVKRLALQVITVDNSNSRATHYSGVEKIVDIYFIKVCSPRLKLT